MNLLALNILLEINKASLNYMNHSFARSEYSIVELHTFGGIDNGATFCIQLQSSVFVNILSLNEFICLSRYCFMYSHNTCINSA